ncbi:MAG: glycosyltransferase [Solirubrobacteraceae bacterium]
MRVAFDSRPTADPQGLGCYSRCLLQALRDTAGEQDEIRESHRPRGADVFHTPWMQGAMLHSPCPMIVTLHDLSALKRPSERLRSGGMHLRLRHLAVQRATHVIVPTKAVADEAAAELGFEHERVIVIPEAPDLHAFTAQQPVSAQPTWTWQDAARETWAAYRRALAQPHRPCVTGSKRRPLSSPRAA